MDKVKDCVSARFVAELDDDILDCEVDSYVGRAVLGLLVQLQAILDSNPDLEPDHAETLIALGVRQAQVWMFG